MTRTTVISKHQLFNHVTITVGVTLTLGQIGWFSSGLAFGVRQESAVAESTSNQTYHSTWVQLAIRPVSSYPGHALSCHTWFTVGWLGHSSMLVIALSVIKNCAVGGVSAHDETTTHTRHATGSFIFFIEDSASFTFRPSTIVPTWTFAHVAFLVVRRSIRLRAEGGLFAT